MEQVHKEAMGRNLPPHNGGANRLPNRCGREDALENTLGALVKEVERTRLEAAAVTEAARENYRTGES